jgi:hypothetical protein
LVSRLAAGNQGCKETLRLKNFAPLREKLFDCIFDGFFSFFSYGFPAAAVSCKEGRNQKEGSV